MNIFIVVPAFNEGKVIGSVIQELLLTGYQVIVVDDASRDDTAEVARSYHCTVIEHIINRGQGAALQTGIQYALEQGADFIVTYDADGQHRVEDIETLLDPVRKGQCDVTLGSRFLHSQGVDHVPVVRRVLLKLAIIYTNFTTGLTLTDTHNGLRAMSASAARKINISQDRMAHASEILEEISRKRISYREVPVTIRYTEYSLEKGQKFGDFVKILFKLIVHKLK